jgi:serine/threonine-protein kinase
MMLMNQVEGYDLRELTRHELLDRVKSLDAGLWRDITDRVACHGPIQAKFMPGAAVTIIRECLTALDKLHSRGIVHGDVKPSNIMLSPEGEVKLIDTGAAFEWRVSRKPYFCTPRYAAPEVLEKGECIPGSDLASLGYVLIELLIGRPIFEGSITPRGLETSLPQEATTGVPQPTCPKLAVEKRRLPGRLREMLPSYSSRVAELCEKLIAPDPLGRFASARDAELYAYDYVRELEQCNLACYFLHELRRWLEALEHAGHVRNHSPLGATDESRVS